MLQSQLEQGVLQKGKTMVDWERSDFAPYAGQEYEDLKTEHDELEVEIIAMKKDGAPIEDRRDARDRYYVLDRLVYALHIEQLQAGGVA